MDVATFATTDAKAFDSLRLVRADGSEYWSARDLMPALGYERWENFAVALDRAKISASLQADHLRGTSKMVIDAFRDATKSKKGRNPHGEISIEVQDFHLSRFACYLVAMNGDPRKPEIAEAQRYFAFRTLQAESYDAPRARGGSNFGLSSDSPDQLDMLSALLHEKAHALHEQAQALRSIAQVDKQISMIFPNHAQPSRPYFTDVGTNYPGVERLREQILAVGAPVTLAKIFEEVLTPAGIERFRGVEMAVSAILKAAGYQRRQRINSGTKPWVYVKPV